MIALAFWAAIKNTNSTFVTITNNSVVICNQKKTQESLGNTAVVLVV